jgi:hypothetical protein
MPEALVAEITANRGELSWRDRLRDRLRHRVRQFSDGGALGSAAFVAGLKQQFFLDRKRASASAEARGPESEACVVSAAPEGDEALRGIGAVTMRRLRCEGVKGGFSS